MKRLLLLAPLAGFTVSAFWIVLSKPPNAGSLIPALALLALALFTLPAVTRTSPAFGYLASAFTSLVLVFVCLGANWAWPLVPRNQLWRDTTIQVLLLLSVLTVPAVSQKGQGFGYLAATVILLVAILPAFVWRFTNGLSSRTMPEIIVNYGMNTPLEAFRMNVGRYPTVDEGLDALIRCPKGLEDKWRGPYISEGKLPLDPWMHRYQYRYPGIHNPNSYDVWSLGPDGVEDGHDIGNWKQ
jgi:general secretion pathway protein G